MHQIVWPRRILHLAQIGFSLGQIGFSLGQIGFLWARSDFLWARSDFLWSGSIFDLDQKNAIWARKHHLLEIRSGQMPALAEKDQPIV